MRLDRADRLAALNTRRATCRPRSVEHYLAAVARPATTGAVTCAPTPIAFGRGVKQLTSPERGGRGGASSASRVSSSAPSKRRCPSTTRRRAYTSHRRCPRQRAERRCGLRAKIDEIRPTARRHRYRLVWDGTISWLRAPRDHQDSAETWDRGLVCPVLGSAAPRVPAVAMPLSLIGAGAVITPSAQPDPADILAIVLSGRPGRRLRIAGRKSAQCAKAIAARCALTGARELLGPIAR